MKSIEIRNISKSYNSTIALKSISFDIEKGEIFGLIGPDGAGKTSLIRILATLILPDSGDAYVNGFEIIKDYKKIRNCIGYMPGKFSLYQDLTVEENINLFAKIFGTTIQENYHLVKDIYSQIEPFKNRLAGKLSGGMKQKLALSCALIHKPDVLFLDEPTTGVDPVSRKEFWEMLKNLKSYGITILVSTPYMDEASLCDRVGLIQEGEILQINKPLDIINSFNKNLFGINGSNTHKLLLDLRKYEFANTVYPFGDSIHYTDSRTNFQIDDLEKYLITNSNSNVSISKITPTIEDCFMDLMVKKEN